MIKTLEKSYRINRSSDGKTLYMKVAQNDETNPDTQPIRPPHTPNLSNPQLSPSGSSARKHETPGILFRMFSPLHQYHLLPCQGTPNTAYCLVIFCDALFALYSLFLPPLLSGRLRDRRRCWVPRSTTLLTTPPCLSNQASPPFDHQISPILLYTACIRVVQHVTAFC